MKIRIQGLTEGGYVFTAEIPPAALSMDSDRFCRPIDTRITVDKRSGNCYIKIHCRTAARFICDRCLASFEKELAEELAVIYTEDENLWANGVDDDLRMVPKSGEEIDLSADIKDALLLTVPIKQICSEDCKGLCPQCGVNLNIETCSCSAEKIDPRWEALRNLKQL